MTTSLAEIRDAVSVDGARNSVTDPSIAQLSQLVARLERVLGVLEPALSLVQQAPPMIATAVDTFDALVAEGRANGFDVDQRVRDALHLLERVSAPETMRALNVMLDRMPALAELAPMLDTVPQIVDDARRTARPIGLLGTLGALRDPNVQAAVGVAVATARTVGQQLTAAQRGRPS